MTSRATNVWITWLAAAVLGASAGCEVARTGADAFVADTPIEDAREPADVGATTCGTTTCTPDQICVGQAGDGDIGIPGPPVCRARPMACDPIECSLLDCCAWSCIRTLCPSGCEYARVHASVVSCP